MKPAVFLDRDGVINKVILDRGRPFSPRRIAELQIIEGVKESVSLMKEKGFEVVVVTNQPDLARGYIAKSMLLEMHAIISHSTGINHFYFCGHDDYQEPRPNPPFYTVTSLYEAALIIAGGNYDT